MGSILVCSNSHRFDLEPVWKLQVKVENFGELSPLLKDASSYNHFRRAVEFVCLGQRGRKVVLRSRTGRRVKTQVQVVTKS